MHPHLVAWEEVTSELRRMAEDADSPLRRLAAQRLFAVAADESLRAVALKDPAFGAPILEAWADSSDAVSLVVRVVAGEVAIHHLGRAQFAFAVVEPYLDVAPELLGVVKSVERAWLVRRLHARVLLGAWIPASWVGWARRLVRAPFTADELARFAAWETLLGRASSEDPRPGLARRVLTAVGARPGLHRR